MRAPTTRVTAYSKEGIQDQKRYDQSCRKTTGKEREEKLDRKDMLAVGDNEI